MFGVEIPIGITNVRKYDFFDLVLDNKLRLVIVWYAQPLLKLLGKLHCIISRFASKELTEPLIVSLLPKHNGFVHSNKVLIGTIHRRRVHNWITVFGVCFVCGIDIFVLVEKFC